MNREPKIDEYIARAKPFARPILEKMRERIHAVVPDVEEAIKWQMPAYSRSGKILLITAAFKAHAALNFWRGQELRKDVADADALGQFGKIKSVDQLPTDAELDRLIRQAADLATQAAPRKPKHRPKAALEIHPEFASALSRAPQAKANLDGFPPSAQRDYFEWIHEAKQDSTRQKRIETALEWLSEGKRRHWKYQSS